MTYEQIEDLKAEDFKRLCGAHHYTFDKMIAALEEDKKKKSLADLRYSLEDQLLIALQYWRGYRIYFLITVLRVSVRAMFVASYICIENALIGSQ